MKSKIVFFVAQVNCNGYNAFGRRRRREIGNSSNGTTNDDEVLDANQPAGQLREEITIESNAILTIERREERLMGPAEGK